MALKINVSFKEIDKEKALFEYANGKMSPSNYIKELIEKDLNKNKNPSAEAPEPVSNLLNW